MIDSSDSSDSSEDERLGAEEDDRDELDDEDDDRAEHEVDEEPLNSADDVSDEEVSGREMIILYIFTCSLSTEIIILQHYVYKIVTQPDCGIDPLVVYK